MRTPPMLGTGMLTGSWPHGRLRAVSPGEPIARQQGSVGCWLLMQQIWFSLAMVFVLVPFPSSGGDSNSGEVGKTPTLAQVWKQDGTYSDPAHGVTFRYPSVWGPSTQFGYWPPALEGSAAPPIAGFGYRVGGFPRTQDEKKRPYSSTNLEGFGIVYSAIAATSTAQCSETAASLAYGAANRTAVFGGHTFTAYETGQGGMSQSAAGNLYATYAGQTCYLFETSVAVSEGAVGDVGGISSLTTAQSHFIEAHLLNILQSVRIAPRLP